MKTIEYRPGVIAFELEDADSAATTISIESLQEKGVSEELLDIIRPYWNEPSLDQKAS